jgi:hypothetical protein
MFQTSRTIKLPSPSPIHESCLVPWRVPVDEATKSLTLGIPKRFKLRVVANMNSTLRASDRIILGIPDMLVSIQSRDTPLIPLWATEVGFSETTEEAVTKLKGFAARSNHLFALTLIDITERHRYVPPKKNSETTELLRDQKELSYKEWLPGENGVTGTGSVRSHNHVWAHAMKVTVTTWLRHPDGGFDLDDHDPDVYACAVRCLAFLPSPATDLPIGTVPQQGAWRHSSRTEKIQGDLGENQERGTRSCATTCFQVSEF